jgi:hypothetical protein
VHQHGSAVWDKAHKNVQVSLYGRDFSFDPVKLHDPEIRNGRAHWQYRERTETFEVDGQKIRVTFKPTFTVGANEVTSDGYVKQGVTPQVGLDVTKVEAG